MNLLYISTYNPSTQTASTQQCFYAKLYIFQTILSEMFKAEYIVHLWIYRKKPVVFVRTTQWVIQNLVSIFLGLTQGVTPWLWYEIGSLTLRLKILVLWRFNGPHTLTACHSTYRCITKGPAIVWITHCLYHMCH